MSFGVGRPKDLMVTNEKLPRRNACKNLGVYMDKRLLSLAHIEYVVEKVE